MGGPVPNLTSGEAQGVLHGWTPDPDLPPKKVPPWVDWP